MAAAVKLVSLLLLLHFSTGHEPGDDSAHTSVTALFSGSSQAVISLLLLGLTVLLSATVYMWLLRYICRGCCQPVAVGVESEALAVIV